MFDTILGLPLHPLVVHAVVVLGPLAALCLLSYAAVPRWRLGLRWPTTLLAVISAGSAFVAKEAGEALERIRGAQPGFDHAERGDLAFISLLVLLVATLLVVFVLARPGASAARVPLALLVALAAAGFAVVAIALAGHTGSQSVWSATAAAITTTT